MRSLLHDARGKQTGSDAVIPDQPGWRPALLSACDSAGWPGWTAHPSGLAAPAHAAMNTTLLHTATGAHPLVVRLADNFVSRLRGLMLAPPLAHGHGLLLTRCGSVHSAFMRQSIDVIYLDRQGRVLRCVAGLAPWRASICPGAAHVLELAAGSIARYRIAPEDRLLHACLMG